MIGMTFEKKANNAKRATRKKRRFAGIYFRDKGRKSKKTENAHTQRFRTGWDCTVLCLLHSGPRIYTGPL
jgi:hypothetical protein